MTKTVVVTSEYPVPAKTLWELIIDGDKFEEIMAGLVTFDGMPSGNIYKGQHIVVDVSLFGKLPKQKYEMTLTAFDNDKMRFHSSEKGAGVKSWEHTCTVAPTESGCMLRDQIEIDAGMMTPLFAMWAKYLYNARHKPRLRLLGLSA